MQVENRANQAIRKNDIVQIKSGKEAGKRGKVLRVLNAKDRLVVEKVNLVKRHQKPNQQNRQGGIVEKEASIHLSSAMLVCDKCNRPVRVRFQTNKDGDSERICHACGAVITKKQG